MPRIKKSRFQPTLGLTLFAGFLCVFMAMLGFWQLQRAEEKRMLQSEMDLRYELEPLMLHESLGSNWQQARYRQVKVKGRFVADKQILIDNRVYNGVAGYHCITPLQITGSELVILVNRGWIKTGNDRAVLPDIVTPEGEVEFFARISPPQSKPPMLPDDGLPDSYSQQVWSYLDLAYFQTRQDMKIEPYILLVQSDLHDGLIREWPRFDGKMGMHIGYAIQWFLLSLIIVILYVVASCQKTEQQDQHERTN